MVAIDFDAETSRKLNIELSRGQRDLDEVVSDAIERMMVRDYFERDLVHKSRSRMTAYERFLGRWIRGGA
jgi:hypothetical protein